MAKIGSSSKKGRQSAKNQASGKYKRQFAITRANKIRKLKKELKRQKKLKNENGIKLLEERLKKAEEIEIIPSHGSETAYTHVPKTSTGGNDDSNA